MTTFEVTDISPAEPNPGLLRGFNIDKPAFGDESEAHALIIEGWVLGRISPVTTVEVISGGQLIQRAPVRTRRPDVAEVHPRVRHADFSGFRTSLSTLGTPPKRELLLQAVLQDGSRVAFATIRGRHRSCAGAGRTDSFLDVAEPAAIVSGQIESPYGHYWDLYAEKLSREIAEADGRDYEWPGDEWGDPGVWETIYEQLFVPAGARDWRRAVEIGPGSGKYTIKVLDRSQAVIRAYDVSPQFLRVCERRCQTSIDEGRLSLRLLGVDRADQMLTDLTSCGWLRKIDALYSIDAMVHVDLQYLIAYLLTAGLVLRPGGKLILTLADATTEPGFRKLLEDIRAEYHLQGKPHLSSKFAWLSPAMVRSILPRLGFELELETPGHGGRDLYLVASLVNTSMAEELKPYLTDAVDSYGAESGCQL